MISWNFADYFVAGVIILVALLTCCLTWKYVPNKAHRIIIICLVFGLLAYLWAELAVGVFTSLGN